MSSLEEVRKERWKDRGGEKPSGRTLGASKTWTHPVQGSRDMHKGTKQTEGHLEFSLLGI